MALATLKELLTVARQGGYAVGSFNFNSCDDALGMVDGAVEKRSPIILMVSDSMVRSMGLGTLAGMVRGMGEAADVPVCLHLDHATDHEIIKGAIRAGFTSVMIDASAEEYEENIRQSKAIVDYARDYGCSVEAELGRFSGREDNVNVAKAAFTDPADVPRFVEETGVDALAISFGSAHGFYKEEPKLDFEVLAGVVAVTDCPLVLHGGTGIPPEDIRKCIQMGISKVNVGTELKAVYMNGFRKAMAELPESQIDPKKYLAYVRKACAQAIMEKIDLFGSADKA